jgi:hypothetical protein
MPAIAAADPSGLSFAGRPFPIEEAEEHFGNLKRRGMNLVRLLITWEALEHSGPGIYDEACLAYLRKLLLEAEKKGLQVIMAPRQDAWSRWTGGEGAPAWTLEKLGFDLERLDGAALSMEHSAENSGGRAYPAMMRPVNYSLYGAATLFTLFFAGGTFAPELSIEGENVQFWLQERYIACFRHCYRRLKNCKALIGWEAMSEPHPGFIGCGDLNRTANGAAALGAVPMQQAPSPWEAMAEASGKKGLSLFKPGFSCPWKQAGVWTGEGEDMRLLRKDHFALYQGRPARFNDDFLKPFMIRFFDRMREAGRPLIFFVQGFPRGEPLSWSEADGGGTVHAVHCCDGIDENLLHPAIWNYIPGNTHEAGEGWNGEGRLRPYPMATAGVPLLIRWDVKRAGFRYRFRAAADIEAPTEIYAPAEWLGAEPRISASGGVRAEYHAEEMRIFVYNQGFEGEVEISVSPGD